MSQFQLDISISKHYPTIQHHEKVMLLGSCFTEHISNRMVDAKMHVCSNPHGILFNPLSIVESLESYIQNRVIEVSELFLLNEIWNHWGFHSRFSDFDRQLALKNMNASLTSAAQFLPTADWLIITLGSAFQYFLNDKNASVANCHRAPGQWFSKQMLSINTIIAQLEKVLLKLKNLNSKLKIIFTISPVRHIRDGVVANNQSKARLLEAVHHLVDTQPDCSYFPAYELVIDVLRDYRFYDVDMVHPNYPATQFVWEHFVKSYFDDSNQALIAKLQEIKIASNHKPRFPKTTAHAAFQIKYLQQMAELKKQYPYINFNDEINHFSKEA